MQRTIHTDSITLYQGVNGLEYDVQAHQPLAQLESNHKDLNSVFQSFDNIKSQLKLKGKTPKPNVTEKIFPWMRGSRHSIQKSHNKLSDGVYAIFRKDIVIYTVILWWKLDQCRDRVY